MSWTKEKNIRNAGHWLARAIELIELKDYKNGMEQYLQYIEVGYLTLN